jgi:hypothetical protein
MSIQNGDSELPSPSRRTFLRSAALAGVGAAATGPLSSAIPASASPGKPSGKWDPDTASRQFTLAVMPDTQFLYWGSQNSINREPQERSPSGTSSTTTSCSWRTSVT